MGKRGPKPTPTAVLKVRGSWLAKTRKSEPKPENGQPICPRWLCAEAKSAWKQIIPKLDAMGVLATIDGNTLARYCSLWVRWKKADAFVQEKGEAYTLRNPPVEEGQEGSVRCVMQWPQVAIVNKLGAELLKIEREFGMTPSSRTGIQIKSSGKEKQDKGRFFQTG